MIGRIFAHFVSVVLHPLLIPTYLFSLLFWLHPYQFTAINFSVKLRILLMVVLNTLILPSLIIYLLQKLNLVRDIQLRHRKDRIYPYLVTALLFGGVYYRLQGLPFPQILELSILAIAITVFVAFLVNFLTKVSMHCVGMAGLAGILFATSPLASYNTTLLLAGVILLAGLVGTVRLGLKVHTTPQVYWGYFIGWFAPILTFHFLG